MAASCTFVKTCWEKLQTSAKQSAKHRGIAATRGQHSTSIYTFYLVVVMNEIWMCE